MSGELDRRGFLRLSSGALVVSAAGTARAEAPAKKRKPDKAPPSERVRLGLIGVAGRGTSLLGSFKPLRDVDIVGVADVYEPHRGKAAKAVGETCQAYEDYRKLLDRKDVDGVVIATPTHWHGPIAIAACLADKDVYVEKPMTYNVHESLLLRKVAAERKRVTQVGTQIHAGANYKRIVEIVRSGILGKITHVRGWMVCNESPSGIGKPADSGPLSGLNWDFWLGSAPVSPFNINKFQKGWFRYFWDYGGGWMTAMAPHLIDLWFYALKDLVAPTGVAASGGRWAVDDNAETPDSQYVLYDFPGMTVMWSHSSANSYGYEFQSGAPTPTTRSKPDKTAVVPCSMKRRIGVVFQGTSGTLAANYGQHGLWTEGDRITDEDLKDVPSPPAHDHYDEFVQCIKTRKQPSCNVAYHHKVNLVCHLANIALRANRKIRWDSRAETIVGDAEAARMMTRDYRRPYTLPV